VRPPPPTPPLARGARWRVGPRCCRGLPPLGALVTSRWCMAAAACNETRLGARKTGRNGEKIPHETKRTTGLVRFDRLAQVKPRQNRPGKARGSNRQKRPRKRPLPPLQTKAPQRGEISILGINSAAAKSRSAAFCTALTNHFLARRRQKIPAAPGALRPQRPKDRSFALHEKRSRLTPDWGVNASCR
jgi:hypothetical protein